MKNIFILYIPPGNTEAMVHYEETINKKVDQERIFRYIDSNLRDRLKSIFDSSPIATWGSRTGENNSSRFSKMQPGDDVLIIEGDNIKLLGKIAAKTISPELSHELWKNLKGEDDAGWDLIYFIANPVEIDLPFSQFKKLFRYRENWKLRGFTNISEEKIGEFYSRYDDLYSILLKMKQGERISEKIEPKVIEQDKIEEESNFVMVDKELSDHIVMQWKLSKLGNKAGSKVWVPRNDQGKIKTEYGFENFEQEFSTGIDTPARYVEQIDVVWKEEFRIDAAFEIENSTAIYSGLLRFSDLTLIAPNSNYPLFIVAPSEKRERVFNQIRRPTFRKIDFDKKVRYLSYESVDEVDKFYSDHSSGLNASVFLDRSESIQTQ